MSQTAPDTKPFDASISDFVSPASFWLPQKLTEPYSWVEHIPFAFWLVGALRPVCAVEIGVHSGNSYFALCQAIQDHQLASRSYAVDTWFGDEQAGFYGEEVFEEFSHYHTAKYSTFSTSIRAVFDEAHQQFADGSIDLLHIDGAHIYEAIKHDFDFWLPKVSKRGLILLHDINFRGRDFGVHRLWAEISQRFPHFEFMHGYGLGMLGGGPAVPFPIKKLMSLKGDSTLAHDVRTAYARLGAHVGLMAAMGDRRREFDRLRSEAATKATDLHEAEERARTSEGTVQALRRIRSDVEQQARATAAAHQQAEERLWAVQTSLTAFKRSLLEANSLILDLRRRLSVTEQSAPRRPTGWLRRNPARAARACLVLYRSAKIIWWTMTLQLHRRLKQWEAAQNTSAVSVPEEPHVQIDLIGTAKGSLVETTSALPALPAKREGDPASAAVDLSEDHAILPGGRKMSIVVCVHNALEYVQRCLASVLEHSREPHEIILIDDNSEEETRNFLQRFALQWGTPLIRHDIARGYTNSVNEGIGASSGDYVVLLNSDTVVTSGWLEAIELTFDTHPRTGIVGTLSNTASWQSVPTVVEGHDWASNPLPAGFKIADVGRLVAERHPSYHSLPFINGFCFALRRIVFAEIGTFDANGFPSGYGEENDFCIRARERGWELRVADNCYVWHAQSKSFSHERRKRLDAEASTILAQKHDVHRDINVPASFCRTSLGMEGVRAWVRRRFERETLIDETRSKYAGARIAFILPGQGIAGGVNVILQEAEALRRFGIEVSLINLEDRRARILSNYPEYQDRWMFAADVKDVPALIRTNGPFDAVISTAYMSTFWAPKQDELPAGTRSGYYIQDFESLFYHRHDLGGLYALASYRWDLKQLLFTKTAWNRDIITAETGRIPHVIGPSVDVDLFQPVDRSRSWPPDGGIRICAMMRPDTTHRGPENTYRLLSRIALHFGRLLQCHTFGCAEQELEYYAAKYAGQVFHHGPVRWRQMHKFLSAMDVFIDMSNWQAMGLTLMEAMASGLLVVGPANGGAAEIVSHGQNGFLVDTTGDDSAFAILEQIIRGEHDVMALRRNAINTAHSFYPEKAAAALADVVLSDRRWGQTDLSASMNESCEPGKANTVMARSQLSPRPANLPC